jgi:tRNA (adenine57-N1/adenine58-N1)-methyltransferase catalytic subunit
VSPPEGSGEPRGGAPVRPLEGSGEPRGGAPVRPLEAGERVLLQDVKGRRYLITLEQGQSFHTHKGRLAHDELIGATEGSVARTDLGQKLLVLRPTLADWVVKMPRGAQVIYPKVLALMVMAADVQPGLTVVEAGAGSGALSIALLQALAPGGRLHAFERRPDFADQARRNVERWFGKLPDGFRLHQGDVVDGIAGVGPVDRVLLDLLEPWLVVPGAADALHPGGLLVSFVATVPQVMRLVEALEGSGRFGLVETSEAIFRPWHVDGLAVRPEHRMIGHTGFLVSARRVEEPWPAPGRLP